MYIGDISIAEWTSLLKNETRTYDILTIYQFQLIHFTIEITLNNFHSPNVRIGLTVIPLMESCTAWFIFSIG